MKKLIQQIKKIADLQTRKDFYYFKEAKQHREQYEFRRFQASLFRSKT